MDYKLAVVAALAAGALLQAHPAFARQYPLRKKLIEYGWDVPTPAYVRQHIREMERRPFDGLIMYLPNDGDAFRDVFMMDQWDEAGFAAVVDDLRNIKWDKFTDNFIIVWSRSNMDWFSDADWEVVTHKVRLMARAAAAGRCKGLCFDPEPYGDNPWAFRGAAHPGASFADYEAEVRKRGAQFMRALAGEMPDAVVHTFFLLSLFRDIMNERDLAQRQELLAAHHYALLPAFVNGLLDAAPANVIITDGDESAYYYTSPLNYYEAYHAIRQNALSLVAPENRGAYNARLQVSQALYVDHVFDLRPGMKSLSSALKPEEQARWFEQNVYYALATADEYAWCYSEHMNWWQNQGVPAGLEHAIRAARAKVAAGEPLGFDISDDLKAAEARQRAELEAKIAHRAAEIPRRPTEVPPPVIDGKLDDAVWQRTPPLQPFLPYVTAADDAAHAATIARVTYDDQNLYVAFRCDEPRIAAVQVLGSARDDPAIWLGDSMDIFLSVGEAPEPFVHFIINPGNVQWDAYYTTKADENISFNPIWQSATNTGDGAWRAEIALPWEQIGTPAPKPGQVRRAQLGRQRIPDGEHSTWSQVYFGFVAPQDFGVWTFR